MPESSFLKSTVFIFPDAREKREAAKGGASKTTSLQKCPVEAFDGDDRPRILIMAETPSYALRLLFLAKEMHASGRMLPVLAVATHVPKSRDLIVTRFQAALENFAWSFVGIPQHDENEDSRDALNAANGANVAGDPTCRTTGLGKVKGLVTKAIGPGANFVVEAMKFRRMVLNSFRIHGRERRDAGEILDRVAPSAVVYIDVSSKSSSVIALAARNRGIRNFSLQLKVWYGGAQLRRRKKQNIFLINAPRFWFWKKLISIVFPKQIWGTRDDAIVFPKQIWGTRDDAVLFYPPWETVGRWLARVLPRDPWTFHGGISDMVSIWDNNVKKELDCRGTLGKRFVIAGSPVFSELFKHKQLAEKTRAELYDKYGLDRQKKLVICSTPVLAEHSLMSETESVAEVDWYFSELARSDANVLVSVHPRGDVQQRKAQAEKWGLATMDEPLLSAMPACDIYVSVLSTTHRWAMMLGKPAIILCTWGVFDYAPGVVFDNDVQCPSTHTVREKEDLGPTLSEMLETADFVADASTGPMRHIEGAEIQDGKSTERILTAIWALVDQGNSLMAARR